MFAMQRRLCAAEQIRAQASSIGRAVMGAGRILIVALALVLGGAAGALAGADTEPVIVVPGRPGVPIIIEGQDVRGAVIEGEWGLARGHTGITIIRPRSLIYPGYLGRSPFVHGFPGPP